MRKLSSVLVFGLTAILCLQCSSLTEPEDPQPEPRRTIAQLTPAESQLLFSFDAFGTRLFREIADRAEPGDNLFVSPLSVSYAFGMLLNGAVGDTRDSLAATLGVLSVPENGVNESYQNLMSTLTQLDPDVTMDIANSIWYRQGIPVEQPFIETNQTYFDALVQGLDFSDESAALTINNWVNDKTRGKITSIIDPPISSEVIMYLINAVYFKADWTLPFNPEYTETADFHRADGSTVDCDMMLNLNTFAYLQNDLLTSVGLPYGEEGFRMTILLPNEGNSVADVLDEMSDEAWAGWLESTVETEVMVGLPKFRFAYNISLANVLQDMGMTIAFNSSTADFTAMTLLDDVYISDVLHKSFVQVDEEGTEAAAVTAIEVSVGSAPSPSIFCDRPFLFVIHEDVSGAILFMGKVAEPVWGE